MDDLHERCKRLQAHLQSIDPSMDVEELLSSTIPSATPRYGHDRRQSSGAESSGVATPEEDEHESDTEEDMNPCKFEWHEGDLAKTGDYTGAALADGMAGLNIDSREVGYLGSSCPCGGEMKWLVGRACLSRLHTLHRKVVCSCAAATRPPPAQGPRARHRHLGHRLRALHRLAPPLAHAQFDREETVHRLERRGPDRELLQLPPRLVPHRPQRHLPRPRGPRPQQRAEAQFALGDALPDGPRHGCLHELHRSQRHRRPGRQGPVPPGQQQLLRPGFLLVWHSGRRPGLGSDGVFSPPPPPEPHFSLLS
jgi:hypothetical protein